MCALNLGSLCDLFVCAKHDIMTSFALHIISNYFKDIGIYLCSVLFGIMASRKTIRINFMGILSQLKELVSEIPDHAQFIKRNGYLLDLVISGFKEDMMHVLFQFFDPKHHCFTFPDYQLVPTLEEFSKLLGIPILDQMPFTGLEKVPKYEDIA